MDVERAISVVRERVGPAPRVAIILGTGLGGFGGRVGAPRVAPYSEIPGWPIGGVLGHAGQLIGGEVAGVPVAVLSGRVHRYEGFSAREVAFGVRVLGGWGVTQLVVTNAAGGIDPSFTPGRLVLIADHINLQGDSPLAGPSREGPQFPDMTDAYSPRLRQIARVVGEGMGLDLPEAVYAAVLGPNFETPAEIRFLRAIGAGLVGMSTVAEVIAARQLGMEVLGLSCVTNPAAGVSRERLSHEEVLEVGEHAAGRLAGLIEGIVPRIVS